MSRPSQVIVLAEDQRHQRFIRQYLYQCGFERRDIRMHALPSGKQCGEQWVRERYSAAVKAYRSRASRAKTALVVAIDADRSSVGERQLQLQRALIQDELPSRGENEAIVHLIPRRSIETWVLCLAGFTVDEETDYSHDSRVDELVPTAARALLEISRGVASITRGCPSLSEAFDEIRRLPRG